MEVEGNMNGFGEGREAVKPESESDPVTGCGLLPAVASPYTLT